MMFLHIIFSYISLFYIHLNGKIEGQKTTLCFFIWHEQHCLSCTSYTSADITAKLQSVLMEMDALIKQNKDPIKSLFVMCVYLCFSA